jgi:hypothetical protein
VVVPQLLLPKRHQLLLLQLKMKRSHFQRTQNLPLLPRSPLTPMIFPMIFQKTSELEAMQSSLMFCLF